MTVIGNRAFGFRRQDRPGGFRASGSGIIDWDPEQIPEKAARIARALARDCGFQSLSYDFLFDSVGELRVSEFSYGFVNHLAFKCPGHWDRDLVWHSGQIWPERAQAEDFLCKYRGMQGA